MLLEPLDSLEYWQLGDVLARNDGMVWIPGDSVGPVDRYWEDEEPTSDQVTRSRPSGSVVDSLSGSARR